MTGLRTFTFQEIRLFLKRKLNDYHKEFSWSNLIWIICTLAGDLKDHRRWVFRLFSVCCLIAFKKKENGLKYFMKQIKTWWKNSFNLQFKLDRPCRYSEINFIWIGQFNWLIKWAKLSESVVLVLLEQIQFKPCSL